jgi:DNA-binding transcriptional LysR family regulator
MLMEIPWSLLPDMPALLIVAEEGHFGRAAERLNVSQSRISQIVRRAEDIVGYDIFARRPHVRLTPAGETLIKAARQAFNELNAGSARAADVAAGRSGTVRLGHAPVAMLTPLPSLLKAFREKYPGVVLELHQTYSRDLWVGLEAGKFDIIVSRQSHVRNGIRNHLFVRDNLVAALPDGDPLASATELTVTALRDRDFIAIEDSISPQWLHSIASVCQSAGFEPRIAQRTHDWAASLALVASGLGVSIVSSTLAQLRFPGVVFVPLTEGVGVGAFWVTSNDEALDPAVTLLRSELVGGATLAEAA